MGSLISLQAPFATAYKNHAVYTDTANPAKKNLPGNVKPFYLFQLA
jgi:hypothetical protein